MTNEEAIKILNEMIEYGWLISDWDKCVAIEALDMAIQSLSAENTAELQPIIRGKWLNVSKPIRDDYLGDVNYAECSVCHSIRVADYFCSCCGADMRKMKELGEQNE